MYDILWHQCLENQILDNFFVQEMFNFVSKSPFCVKIAILCQNRHFVSKSPFCVQIAIFPPIFSAKIFPKAYNRGLSLGLCSLQATAGRGFESLVHLYSMMIRSVGLIAASTAQGDQIRRSCAYWAIVYNGQFFLENYA
jgi:hypothetical protein